MVIGNNNVCQMISQVRNVLILVKAHISLGILCGAAASTALVAGVNSVGGDRASVSTHMTTTDQPHDSVQHDVLGLN